MLLHHAIKFEYGGWRVWVDTLAIVHSKVVIFIFIFIIVIIIYIITVIIIIIIITVVIIFILVLSNPYPHSVVKVKSPSFCNSNADNRTMLHCTNQVSFEEFKLQFSAMYEQVISNVLRIETV